MNDGHARRPLRLDPLQAAAGPGWQVRLHEVATSTNVLAAAAPEPGLVVVADHQTAGRGRLGRAWVAPPGVALTFSAVVDPGLDDEWWPLLPLVAGYAVAQGIGGSLKWPNDVLLAGRKVCGVLVERVSARSGGGDRPLAVVGIGLNVHQSAEELPVPVATSLALADRPRDRTELFGAVLGLLREHVAAAAAAPHTFADRYRPLCETLGVLVRVDLPGGAVLEGRAEDVDGHGRLLVRVDGAVVPVAAGDVVHVRPAG